VSAFVPEPFGPQTEDEVAIFEQEARRVDAEIDAHARGLTAAEQELCSVCCAIVGDPDSFEGFWEAVHALRAERGLP